MKFNFNNKIVVITGGTHGIGLACCEKFLKNGAKVITFSRSEKNIKNAIKKFKKNFYVYKGDVTNIEFLNNFSKSIIKKFKYVSILVHNVGGGGRWGSENIFNTKNHVWEEVYKKNIQGVITLNNFFLKTMVKKKWGRVIAISSTNASEVSYGDRPWFTAAKSSQLSIIKNLSKNRDFTKKNITFNSISPGPIFIKNTYFGNFRKKNINKYKLWIKKNIPINRIGNVEDVSNLVLYVSSDYSSFINGSNIIIDGGKSNRI